MLWRFFDVLESGLRKNLTHFAQIFEFLHFICSPLRHFSVPYSPLDPSIPFFPLLPSLFVLHVAAL